MLSINIQTIKYIYKTRHFLKRYSIFFYIYNFIGYIGNKNFKYAASLFLFLVHKNKRNVIVKEQIKKINKRNVIVKGQLNNNLLIYYFTITFI